MRQSLRLKRGYDLRLKGAIANQAASVWTPTSMVAVIPDDFPGFSPKPEVKEGDAVNPGSPLLCDKKFASMKLVSPVGGTVRAIVRGERRKILRVEIEVAGAQPFTAPRPQAASLQERLLQSGLWALISQRPYAIVPRPDVRPRNIFVTAFDSAPLAPDMAAGLDPKLLEAGVKALASLTDGHVYVSCRPGELPDLEGAVMVDVAGPHPAGNPGIQAANLAPVNKGETIWALNASTLQAIGAMERDGKWDTSVTVAIVGPEVETPSMVATYPGAQIAPLLKGKLKPAAHHQRVISGNPLTGTAESPAEGFLHRPWRQVTVIAEGDDRAEFMGWASLSPSKMSRSHSFLSGLFGGRRSFAPDARLLGGKRAMIMSGVYDNALPADIPAEYLLKAIMGRDIERMEQLGIYEVAPEDFALAEALDPSKIELQKIVREGLDFLRKELE